jgi:hypothetical protein
MVLFPTDLGLVSVQDVLVAVPLAAVGVEARALATPEAARTATSGTSDSRYQDVVDMVFSLRCILLNCFRVVV